MTGHKIKITFSGDAEKMLDDSLTKCALAWKIEINVTGKMK